MEQQRVIERLLRSRGGEEQKDKEKNGSCAALTPTYYDNARCQGCLTRKTARGEQRELALEQRLELVRIMEGHQGVFDRDPAVFSELAERAGDCFTRGAGHGRHLLVREQQWEAELAGIEMFADLIGQFEQQPSQAGSYGLRKSDAAGVLQGKAVFLADALDGAHLRFFMAAQEVEEPLALDGAQLGGGQ